MVTTEINDRKSWDAFVLRQRDYTFLQGWSWGEFNRAQGARVWRLGVFENDVQIACCQVLRITARRGNFLFIPHGPLLEQWSTAVFESLLEAITALAKKERCTFIRISPWLEATPEHKRFFKAYGFRNAPTHMHAEETWLLPLAGSEVDMLAGMRKNTRNLVRRAEREGVVIRKTTDFAQLGALLRLQDETAARHHFVPFSKNYLENEFKIFTEHHEALLFLGSHQGVIVSAAIIIFYGTRAFYFQSGSVHADAPVSHLLQWEVIKEARARGCTIYNLWGVAPEHKPKHQWAGLTLFKSGFGGYRKNYMHAQDLPLTAGYWISYIIEKIPRTVRGYMFKKHTS